MVDSSKKRFAPALCVFAGGVIGTSIRAALSFLQPSDAAWPAATFAVNLCGAFILGFLLEYLSLTGEDKGGRKLFRLFAGTGIMGGFTTYGTFILEVDTRFQQHQVALALTYMIVSILAGLALAGAGVLLANRIANRRVDKYAEAHGLRPVSAEFGTVDLDAPDALNDPGNLESNAAPTAQGEKSEPSEQHDSSAQEAHTK